MAPARTSVLGAVLCAPAALAILVMLHLTDGPRWLILPTALVAAALSVAGSRAVLGRAGRMRPERTAPALVAAAVVTLGGAAILLMAPDQALAGAALALVAPALAFSVLDASPARTWVIRIVAGAVALLPGYLAAFGVTVGWMALTPDLPGPEWLGGTLLFAPGMAVAHGIVYCGATVLTAGRVASPADA